MHNFLTNLSIFGDLDEAAVQALAAELEVLKLPSGGVLFHQGDPGDALYIVVSGKLRLIQSQPNGVETCLDELAPGACVGEMALLTGRQRIGTVIASEETELARLSKAAFERLAEDHPSLLVGLASQLSPRFQRAQGSLILTRLFGELDKATLNELQSNLEWLHLNSGQVLFRQGDPGEAMYIVVQGRLRFAVEEPGGRSRILGEVGAGESIGEFALFAESGSPESLRSATVYATRLTDVITITRPVFEGLLCQYPQLLLSLTRRVIQRQRLIVQSSLPEVRALAISVIPVRPGAPVDAFTSQLASALSALGSTLLLSASSFEQLYGKPGSAQTPLDHPASAVIHVWLDEHEREQNFVIYQAAPALDESGQMNPWTHRCLENADVILLVGEASTDPTTSPVEAALPTAQTRARLELALLHADDCQMPQGTQTWLAARRAGAFPVQAHHHVRLGNASDFRRLARRVSGRPVGLALSGGGARGWAHIGVFRALQEANLEVDWVAGSSMGAILAACFALEWPLERIDQLATRFANPKLLLDYTLPYTAITATRRVTSLLQELSAGINVEDTWRPFFCVSSNLTKAEERLHFSGPLWKAIRASMAFPAVFSPVLDEGCILADGGAVNNLPIDRMRQVCPTGTVIGVELVTDASGGNCVQQYNFGPSLSGWQVLFSRLNPFAQPIKAPTLLEIVASIVDNNSRQRLNEVRRFADLLIQVPVDQYGLLEFDQYAEIAELGYTTAKKQLEGFRPR
ncbi:MAG: cyclic nucleotide-binding and patatin-like phospholipase domain-containing protein [Chloroflexota bacterium]